MFNVRIKSRLQSHNFYFHSRSKIMELEEELKVVGNSLKSLEVSEEKVQCAIVNVAMVYFLYDYFAGKQVFP